MKVCVVVTEKYFMDLGTLSEAAMQDIAHHYKLTGDHATVTAALREMLLHSTYAEIDPIFHVLHEVAVRHGHTDKVRVIPSP